MNLLFVATKAPWPPIDGGRLLLARTLEALAALGHRATLVAPVEPGTDRAAVAAALSPCCRPRLVSAAPRRPLATLAYAWARNEPFSIVRHALPAVRREVELALEEERFDLIHAEQLQALPQALGAAAPRGLPVVLRAQNVESDLWFASAHRREGPLARWLGGEGQRLAKWEGGALGRVAATVAISTLDAERLRVLGGPGARVYMAPVPFPVTLPAPAAALPGAPAVVVLGSGGWLPNRDGTRWFVEEVWPAVRAACPGAKLHLFGQEIPSEGESVVSHPAPAESAEAFAPGAILAVPLRIASGVRMKVLEAWARGLPVVATPEALSGLGARDGHEALVAVDPKTFARAIAALHREPETARSLVEAGRDALSRTHEPIRAARELLAVYSSVLGRRHGAVGVESVPTNVLANF
ncbi:MAG TPA: glycosyltransferase family 4 protein [Thermoanaerobaculia bacterium]|nr:glycosyltransferase family 4 protein [Thermoanaerobaculia bacterium]